MNVAVVGAGLGGLTAARRLMQAGATVTVFEAGSEVGGVIGSRRDGGWLWELAASSFLGGAADGGAALCEELGVSLDRAAPAARQRWIWVDGKRRALPRGPLGLLTTDLLTWRGKLDLVREPFRAAPPEVGTEETVHAFAARRLGPEAARAIVAPFVTGVYAASAHDVSLDAGFPRLAAIAKGGGLVRGALRAQLGRLRARLGGERARPNHLSAPVGGMGALVVALGDALGDRVVTSTPVTAIGAADDGGVTITTASGRTRHDAAVVALPARLASPLLADLAPELSARLAAITRAPVAVVYLGYRSEQVPAATDGFGLLVAQGEEPRVLGVVFESTVWPDRAPSGHVLLRCIYGGARDPSAASLDDDALLRQAEADVATALDAEGAPVHRGIVRWRDGISPYPVGHRERVATIDALARRHHLVMAGADYHGISINDLCADARRVATEVGA